MSQLKINQAAREVEICARRFDHAITGLSHALEGHSEKAGMIVNQASGVLNDPKKVMNDFVGEKRVVVESYIKENADHFKAQIKEEASMFLRNSFDDAGKLSEEVIDRVENRVRNLISNVRTAAEDGLQLSNNQPRVFLGALFGIGFLAGLMVTRRGFSSVVNRPASPGEVHSGEGILDSSVRDEPGTVLLPIPGSKSAA